MFNILLVIVIVCGSFASAQVTFRADYTFFQDVNGWIKLHEIPESWHDARLRCHAEGATLASPTDSNFRDTMISVMITQTTQPSPGIYSGIHSTFSNGTFTTIEGVPVSSVAAKWITGQPDNVYTKQCVVFHTNATLETVNCSNIFMYICYKKFENLILNQCGTVDNNYMKDTRTGHCYKVHKHGENWPVAHMTCIAEGGYLVIINSDTEAEVIKDLIAKAKNLDVIAIGFRRWPEKNSWYTVHGQTLEEAGYEKWADGEPNNWVLDGEPQSCGAVKTDSRFDDIWCYRPFPFICEKIPE